MAAAASGFFLGGMLDEELNDELVDEHGGDLGVDEEEISACAPYLARQMSCLGRVTPGVKDTPIFRFGTGREGGCRSSHPE